MKLVVVTGNKRSLQEEAGDVIKLLNNGLDVYHLRKYEAKKDELKSFLSVIPEKFHNKIVLHSHFELLEEFDLKGIHLNENNRKRGSEIRNLKKIISTSFHDLDELIACKEKYEYVFFSPVHESISKLGYQPKYSQKEIANAVTKTQQNVIALGGISEKNISEISKMGFMGAALSGAVWNGVDPVKAFLKIKNKISF